MKLKALFLASEKAIPAKKDFKNMLSFSKLSALQTLISVDCQLNA